MRRPWAGGDPIAGTQSSRPTTLSGAISVRILTSFRSSGSASPLSFQEVANQAPSPARPKAIRQKVLPVSGTWCLFSKPVRVGSKSWPDWRDRYRSGLRARGSVRESVPLRPQQVNKSIFFICPRQHKSRYSVRVENRRQLWEFRQREKEFRHSTAFIKSGSSKPSARNPLIRRQITHLQPVAVFGPGRIGAAEKSCGDLRFVERLLVNVRP